MKKTKRSVWVFDIDDTLAMNEWQYSAAFAHFFHYLYQNFTWMMPNFNDVQKTFKEIDEQLFISYGINRGRVAESMLKTYEEICNWIEGRWGINARNQNHEREIAAIGDSPFEFTRMEMLNNAKIILGKLKSRGDKLCCLSSYDKQVFPQKAKFLKLYAYFKKKNIKLLPGKKTTADFIEASGWKPELDNQCHWHVVGNGPSDVLPAMQISENWRGFYIPHGSTSALFKNDAACKRFTPCPIDHPRIITLRDIKDILNYI